MDHYLFAVRSATQAQRAARVLNSGGIHASVQRVPVEFARQGCTYAVRVDEADYDVAQQRLQQAHLCRSASSGTAAQGTARWRYDLF